MQLSYTDMLKDALRTYNETSTSYEALDRAVNAAEIELRGLQERRRHAANVRNQACDLVDTLRDVLDIPDDETGD